MDKEEEQQMEKKPKKKEQINELELLLEEANSKLLLAQADLINYRKRKDIEVNDKLKYANQELIEDLLLVVDNFERAVKLDDNELSDELSKFLTGFKMIYAALVDMLGKYGVKEIDLLHQQFDPNNSEILIIDNDQNYEDNIVLDVLRKGYKLHDKTIRIAHVKINKLNKEKENE